MEEAVVDAKCRPAVLFPNGGATPEAKKMRQAAERGEETPKDRRGVAGGGDDESEDSDEGTDYEDDRLASPLPPVMPSATQMLLSLNTSSPITSAAAAMMAARLPGPAARKRSRTRFSPEQKQALSERLGWRLQKHDEALVDDCCREIGVGKAVFKVWMHNNKHNFLAGHSSRRSSSSVSAAPSAHPAPPPPAAASAPPVHADFNNGSSDQAAADHSAAQPATASGIVVSTGVN